MTLLSGISETRLSTPYTPPPAVLTSRSHGQSIDSQSVSFRVGKAMLSRFDRLLIDDRLFESSNVNLQDIPNSCHHRTAGGSRKVLHTEWSGYEALRNTLHSASHPYHPRSHRRTTLDVRWTNPTNTHETNRSSAVTPPLASTDRASQRC